MVLLATLLVVVLDSVLGIHPTASVMGSVTSVETAVKILTLSVLIHVWMLVMTHAALKVFAVEVLAIVSVM